MTIQNLDSDFDYLFKCNFFSDDFDPENQEEHLDFAKIFLNQYSWNEVYILYFRYLTANCQTAESVYNATNLFYYYGFIDNPIDEPYELIGYILYRIDLEKDWEQYGDFVDSFVISVLENCGKLNLKKDPYYQPWKDEKILAAIKKWQDVKN